MNVALMRPDDMAVRTMADSTIPVDAFEHLLLLAGLNDVNDLPPRGAALSSQKAAQLLTVLLNQPVTLGSFPPRMAFEHLLREILEGGEASHEKLLRRMDRFKTVDRNGRRNFF